jgi:hypothetical protein
MWRMLRGRWGGRNFELDCSIDHLFEDCIDPRDVNEVVSKSQPYKTNDHLLGLRYCVSIVRPRVSYIATGTSGSRLHHQD